MTRLLESVMWNSCAACRRSAMRTSPLGVVARLGAWANTYSVVMVVTEVCDGAGDVGMTLRRTLTNPSFQADRTRSLEALSAIFRVILRLISAGRVDITMSRK